MPSKALCSAEIARRRFIDYNSKRGNLKTIRRFAYVKSAELAGGRFAHIGFAEGVLERGFGYGIAYALGER